MAPINRRSQNRGIGKQPVRRRVAHNDSLGESWASVEPIQNGYHSGDSDDDGEDLLPQQLTAQPLPDDSVDELRDVADRVGKEVETFAEMLDRFYNDLPMSDKFEAVHDLVQEFRTIADRNVVDLTRKHERQLREQLRKERAKQIDGGRILRTASVLDKKIDLSGVTELREWQAEADTWELFQLMLELRYRPDRAQEREEKLANLSQAHRYSTEGKLHERFLVESDVAKERSVILKWLEQTADHSTGDLSTIMEELEAKAGRGKGLWTHGWMHTREKIKGEKRLRTWPNPTSSPLPQIRRSDDADLLVTTLDPDAPLRQGRTLEQPDVLFERSMWMACWEMLRRGKTIHEICDWCSERNEGWRALSMGQAHEDAAQSSGIVWRRMCQVAAESGCQDEYEAAIYGLLAGDGSISSKACRSWYDHVWSFYRSNLTRQHDAYLLANFPQKVLPSILNRAPSAFENESQVSAWKGIHHLVRDLRQSPALQNEAMQPFIMLNAYILGHDLESLLLTLGIALSDRSCFEAAADDVFVKIRPPPATLSEVLPEVKLSDDTKVMRILAHMLIVLRTLRTQPADSAQRDSEENVLIAYMQLLRVGRKPDLLPMYASMIRGARGTLAVSRQMQDVKNGSDQNTFMRMLRRYGVDCADAIDDHVGWTMGQMLAVEDGAQGFSMLETSDEDFHPGQRITLDAMSKELKPKEAAVVKSLEWYLLLDGYWNVAFAKLTQVVLTCLLHGHFSTALHIVEFLPCHTVSIAKSHALLGHSIDVHAAAYEPATPEAAARLSVMQRQSRTYYELSQLITAIALLTEWREREEEYTTQTPRPSAIPAALKRALAALQDVMEPLLAAPTPLTHSQTAQDAADLADIRTLYLPEIVLAYNTALHSAGHLISRDNLIASMDLSVAVADGRRQLGEAVARAGRMREVVRGFAETGKAMLKLKAVGKVRRDRRDGRALSVWEIGE